MKKYILPLLLLLISNVSIAQAPDWYESDMRNRFYPKETFFCGFAMNEIAKGESLNDALEKVKTAARVEAVSTIRVHVQSLKQDYSHSDTYANGSKEMADFYQRFESLARLSTDIDIPGLKIESYRDGNIVAAFAFVKRRDLQRQLEKQITMGIARIETQMDNANELINNGQKAEARKRVDEIGKDFANIERNQDLLLAIDSSADKETLQLQELQALKQRHAQMMASLKNGIYVVLQCNAQAFGEPYPTLQNELKGKLAELGCSFTDNAEEADWLIVISSNAREYHADSYGQYTSYFVFVDSHISITKQATKQKVYEDEISVKGGDTRSNQNAARAAFKDTTSKLAAIIKEQINQ